MIPFTPFTYYSVYSYIRFSFLVGHLSVCTRQLSLLSLDSRRAVSPSSGNSLNHGITAERYATMVINRPEGNHPGSDSPTHGYIQAIHGYVVKSLHSPILDRHLLYVDPTNPVHQFIQQNLLAHSNHDQTICRNASVLRTCQRREQQRPKRLSEPHDEP